MRVTPWVDPDEKRSASRRATAGPRPWCRRSSQRRQVHEPAL